MFFKRMTKIFILLFSFVSLSLVSFSAQAGWWQDIKDFFNGGLTPYNLPDDTSNEPSGPEAPTITEFTCSRLTQSEGWKSLHPNKDQCNESGDKEYNRYQGERLKVRFVCTDGVVTWGIRDKYSDYFKDDFLSGVDTARDINNDHGVELEFTLPQDLLIVDGVDVAGVFWFVCEVDNTPELSAAKNFYFNSEPSLSVEFHAPSEIKKDQTTQITVTLGTNEVCGPNCSGNLFSYENEFFSLNDDHLKRHLVSVNSSRVMTRRVGDTTPVLDHYYTATYELTPDQLGEQDLTIMLTGNDYVGQIVEKTFTFDVIQDDPDADGDGYTVTADGDCDDSDPSIHPGATEICDSVDNNCDGNVDEGVMTTYYHDGDADGYGDASTIIDACTPPADYVTDSSDCNDSSAQVNPGADEICANGSDDDCDGATDEPAPDCVDGTGTDSDGDGYDITTDCDDSNPNTNPGATETCDSVDNDCDGSIDEGVTTTYYYDGDSDGYGDATNTIEACTPPTDYETDGTDCDDNDFTSHPGATEWCGDLADNDCDGLIDEPDCSEIVKDEDGDGFDNTVDCDDHDSKTYPGATENCNDNKDNDCNGQVNDTSVCPTTPSEGPAPTQQSEVSGGAATSLFGCSLMIGAEPISGSVSLLMFLFSIFGLARLRFKK